MVIRTISSATSNNYNTAVEPVVTPASSSQGVEAPSRSEVRGKSGSAEMSPGLLAAIQKDITPSLQEAKTQFDKSSQSLDTPAGQKTFRQIIADKLNSKGYNVTFTPDKPDSRDRATASSDSNVTGLPARSLAMAQGKREAAIPNFNIEIKPNSPALLALQNASFELPTEGARQEALVNSDAKTQKTDKTDSKTDSKTGSKPDPQPNRADKNKDKEPDVPRYILRPHTTGGNPYIENPEWRAQQDRKKAEANGASRTPVSQGVTEKNNEVHSNIGAYGTIAERTPKDLPEKDSARSKSQQVASIDKHGNVIGFDKGETFRLPSQRDMERRHGLAKQGRYLTLIHDINDKSSLVINAGIQTDKIKHGDDDHQIRSANIGMGDDLAVILDGHDAEAGKLSTPTVSYNGQAAQKMEVGKAYFSNDGAKVRYLIENGVGKLKIVSAEQEVHFDQQPGDNYLTFKAQLLEKADAHALGLIGIMEAEGQQFVQKSQRSIEDYAQRYAAVSDRFGAALPNHSRQLKGMHETGDVFTAVDDYPNGKTKPTKGYYLPGFYDSLRQVSAD